LIDFGEVVVVELLGVPPLFLGVLFCSILDGFELLGCVLFSLGDSTDLGVAF
jgi:hypothetical protein